MINSVGQKLSVAMMLAGSTRHEKRTNKRQLAKDREKGNCKRTNKERRKP
jgi:hypothetical protein